VVQHAGVDIGQDEQGGRRLLKPTKFKRAKFESELKKLHVELVKLQDWVKQTGAKIVILFEEHDAAGKGGVIKCITEQVSPRVFRVAALPAPTERRENPRCISSVTSRIFRQPARS
jgi:polyphosphate kinase 2 (PPK2 family)